MVSPVIVPWSFGAMSSQRHLFQNTLISYNINTTWNLCCGDQGSAWTHGLTQKGVLCVLTPVDHSQHYFFTFLTCWTKVVSSLSYLL